VADDFEKPNGIAFSRDESILYVADTGISHKENGPKHIRALNLKPDGKTLGASKGVCRLHGGPVRWLSAWIPMAASGPAQVMACTATCRTASLIGKIHIPELVANVCFGGLKRNRLFICGCTSLYSVYLDGEWLTSWLQCRSRMRK
jgi:gluconolactonase